MRQIEGYGVAINRDGSVMELTSVHELDPGKVAAAIIDKNKLSDADFDSRLAPALGIHPERGQEAVALVIKGTNGKFWIVMNSEDYE